MGTDCTTILSPKSCSWPYFHHGKAFQLVLVNSISGHLCLKPLRRPGDRKALHVDPGAKFGELARILLDEEPADELAVPQGERSPGTAPVSGTNPFVSLPSTGRIRIPPDVTGVCAWTSSAGTGWFECFPPPEGGRGALGCLGSQPVEEEAFHRGARPRRFSAPFCRQNTWRWESSPKICRCRFLKTL